MYEHDDTLESGRLGCQGDDLKQAAVLVIIRSLVAGVRMDDQVVTHLISL